MNYWLVKSEPYKYSWENLEEDKETFWDGVRNYQARNNLKAMKKNDLLLFYHSNEGKEIVGIAKVVKTAYQDPTTDDERWVAVNIIPVKKLPYPVALLKIKETPELQNMELLRQQRLSVVCLTYEEFSMIQKMGGL